MAELAIRNIKETINYFFNHSLVFKKTKPLSRKPVYLAKAWPLKADFTALSIQSQ